MGRTTQGNGLIVESNFDFEQLMRRMASRVEPTAEKKEAAARSHNNLRTLLMQGTFGGRVVDTYLSGSYSRGTAIHPIDDVDIVFLIDHTAWREGDILFSDLPNPTDVLRSFSTALRRRYARTSVYTQRRSVRLALSHLDIDIVPAIPLEDNLIQIPDTHTGDWIRSGPAIHRELGASINARTDGVFKPTVKLIKYWNSRLPRTARFKSFTVESMAMALFARHSGDDLFDSVLSFYDFMAHVAGETSYGDWNSHYGIDFGMWGPTVPDPSGATSNVVRGLDADVIERFFDHAIRTRNNLVKAAESARSATAGRLLSKALKFETVT